MASRILFIALTINLLVLLLSSSSSSEEEPSKKVNERVTFYIFHELEQLKDLIKNGVPEFFIPSLEPVRPSSLTLEGSPTDGAQISAHHYDMTLFGLSSLHVSRVEVQLEQEKLSLEVHFDKWTLKGKYHMIGRLLDAIPLFGEGPFEMNFTDINMSGNATLKMDEKGSLNIGNLHTNLDVKDLSVHYHDLYGGGKLSVLGNRLLKHFAERTFHKIHGKMTKNVDSMLEKLLNRKFRETTFSRIMAKS